MLDVVVVVLLGRFARVKLIRVFYTVVVELYILFGRKIQRVQIIGRAVVIHSARLFDISRIVADAYKRLDNVLAVSTFVAQIAVALLVGRRDIIRLAELRGGLLFDFFRIAVQLEMRCGTRRVLVGRFLPFDNGRLRIIADCPTRRNGQVGDVAFFDGELGRGALDCSDKQPRARRGGNNALRLVGIERRRRRFYFFLLLARFCGAAFTHGRFNTRQRGSHDKHDRNHRDREHNIARYFRNKRLQAVSDCAHNDAARRILGGIHVVYIIGKSAL